MAFNLAIETSGRAGAIALGRDDTLLAERDLGEHQRHNVVLVAGLAALCRVHDVAPADVAELYVSIGPGSFTGLRVAVAAAKMLALAHNTRLVAVPTLDALALNAPAGVDRVAVGLNLKRDRLWSRVYERHGEAMTPLAPPALRTINELIELADMPRLALLGDPLPALDAAVQDRVDALPVELARVRAAAVWRLGRALAQAGGFADAATLAPLYAREPEAMTKWRALHGT